MFIKILIIFSILASFLNEILCKIDYGPDPWHYESNSIHKSDSNIPPDLQYLPPTKPRIETNFAQNDWFLKRIIALILKGGLITKNEDEKTVEIYLQMKFPAKQWDLLNDYTQYTQVLSDEMLRRAIGYMEEAIYKPSFTEKISQAWSDYVQTYLSFYKVEIIWTLIIISILVTMWYLYHRLSHKNMLVLSFFGIYAYEACVSYMESEKEEYENFLKAVNICKWYFWSSNCQLPQPDPLVFLKHMHPLKIGIRIITTLVTEPMINISSTIQRMIHGLTDNLWYPLNSIVYGVLIVILNVLLIIFIIMILYNYILNVPFNLSFCAGLIDMGVKQRKRQIFTETPTLSNDINSNDDKLSGQNLNNFLNIFAQYIDKSEKYINHPVPSISNIHENKQYTSLKRSSSAGRLTQFMRLPCNMDERIAPSLKNRHKHLGSGDD